MRPILLAVSLGCALTAPALAQYPSQRSVGRKAQQIARSAHVQLSVLGRSRGGRPIWMMRIARPGAVAPDERPALLIVGGVHGEHRLGVALALSAARRFVAVGGEAAKLLKRRTVYVVPLANPDGYAHFRGTRGAEAGNTRAVDRDRDGRLGEDGPSDLDGDGIVRWMRVRDLAGEYVVDPLEPRLLRKADRLAGERGVYKLLREGAIDEDQDGEVDEDSGEGVRVDRNFPYRFARHTPEHGPYATSEPAALALVKLLVERPQIGLVLTYGLDDNLVATPKPAKLEAGKPVIGIHPKDHGLFARIGADYRTLTKVKGRPRGVPSGAFHEWAYSHRGLLSLAARGWHGPSDMPPLKSPDKGAKGKGKKPAKKVSKHPDAPWLALADRLGQGFAPWKTFEHPTLGTVEIGGFDPRFKFNPPASEVRRISKREAPFVESLLGRLPELKLDIEASALPGGLVRIKATVRNEGWLPSATVQGQRTRAVMPVAIELRGKLQLIGAQPEGRVLQVLPLLAGKGGRYQLSWIVRPQGEMHVELRTGRGWTISKRVTLGGSGR